MGSSNWITSIELKISEGYSEYYVSVSIENAIGVGEKHVQKSFTKIKFLFIEFVLLK